MHNIDATKINNPKVCIGMPVYNGARFITDAIQSLLNQEYTDFILIISDNASTDETEQICRAYVKKDQRIKYVRQESNIGAVRNFEYVLENSRSQYFMWAAHDDYWDRRFLSELVAMLDERKDRVLAFCNARHVDTEKKIIRNYNKLEYLNPGATKCGIQLNSLERFILQDHLHGKANLIYGLIKREILLKSKILSKWGDFGWGADLLMVAQLLRYGDVAITSNELWQKTQNPDGLGSIKLKKRKKSFLNSFNGAINTLSIYNRYAGSYWKLQGNVDGGTRVPLFKRIIFVSYAVSRYNIRWIAQVFGAPFRK